jgi:ABC-type branched-subunit amino acid transport system ATPase component
MLFGKNLSKSFGNVKAVEDVSFECEQEQVTSLIGPNGAGKTSVFNLISGILQPDSGSVVFKDRDVTSYNITRKARNGIGRMFQDPHCFGDLTTLENVAMGTFHTLSPWERLKPFRYKNREELDFYIEAVGLQEKRHEKGSSLTFGERRLMNIAQLLAAGMELMLLDEPTVGLDDATIERLGTVIRDLTRVHHKTVLLIEHHYDMVTAISDKVLFMVQGRLVSSGTVQEIEKSDDLRRLYLG